MVRTPVHAGVFGGYAEADSVKRVFRGRPARRVVRPGRPAGAQAGGRDADAGAASPVPGLDSAIGCAAGRCHLPSRAFAAISVNSAAIIVGIAGS